MKKVYTNYISFKLTIALNLDDSPAKIGNKKLINLVTIHVNKLVPP